MKKTVYVFNCSNQRMRFGLTYDQIGSNLPKNACSGKWILFKTLLLEPSDPPLLNGLKSTEIIETLDKDEYLIQDIRIIFKEQVVRGDLKK
jgi:hypothetical protein